MDQERSRLADTKKGFSRRNSKLAEMISMLSLSERNLLAPGIAAVSARLHGHDVLPLAAPTAVAIEAATAMTAAVDGQRLHDLQRAL